MSMRTRYLATVPLDQGRLAKDLEHSQSFKYSEAYSNYLIGGPWKSAMLYSAGGESGDGLLTNYDYEHGSAFTEYGNALPYVRELIEQLADVTRLSFVRLAVFTKSVIVPHRDFIELAEIPEGSRSAHRVHIPLATNEHCFFSEDNTVYRMRSGEVWYFDAAQIHSVASFSDEPRIHLTFDFVDRPGPGPLVAVDRGGPEGVRAESVADRPPLPDAERAALGRLAGVLTKDTFNEVFSIVVKTHFRYDGGPGFAWDTITDLARASSDPDVLPHALELRTYFTLERPAGSGRA
jgi:L-proline cis-4-hydroxylase